MFISLIQLNVYIIMFIMIYTLNKLYTIYRHLMKHEQLHKIFIICARINIYARVIRDYGGKDMKANGNGL